VNRGVTLGGTRLGVYHFSRGELASHSRGSHT
jgi:hypothetical protein